MPIALFALACNPWTETVVDGLRRLDRTVRTDLDGFATVRLRPQAGETAVLWTLVAPADELVRLRRWAAPDGTAHFDADAMLATAEAKTSAAWLTPVNTFGWPIVDQDAPLDEAKWTAEIQATDGAGVPIATDIAVSVLLKVDDDLEVGELPVHLVLQDDIGNDTDAVAAIDDAVAQWASLVASAGISLTVTQESDDGASVGAPGFSDPAPWQALGGRTPLRPVDVVFRRVIPEFPTALGIAGNIPAPLVATGESGVLVGLDYAAGPDGGFDDLDLRLLAETLAHETGHATGLFHPVEIGWELYDALVDTTNCDREGSCEEIFAANLMFPYPVCPTPVDCIAQDTLSADQRSVVHRYVATR